MMTNPLHILQVFASLNMGGAECRMMDVYRNADRTEIQFDFVTLTPEKQYFEDEIQNLGGKVYKLKSPREIGFIKHINEIRSCIKRNNYDVVHAHTSYHCGIVMLAAWLEHVPVRISHARTTGSQSKSKGKTVLLVLGRVLINLFATKKLAISNAAGRYVFGNHKYEVLPNAIDIDKYQGVDKAEIDTLRSELGLNISDFVIGQIGRFDPMKNHEFTVKWFKQFLEVEHRAKIIFIGDGQLREGINELVASMDISNRVIFTGARNDVYKMIHLLDVLFFPSIFEGLGGVAIEAQAVGIPVVESNTVPIETDMGLGLVQRIALNAGLSDWTNAVLKSKELSRPSYKQINVMFKKNKYILSSTINRLTELYKGQK